jgi:hypothetical protein
VARPAKQSKLSLKDIMDLNYLTVLLSLPVGPSYQETILTEAIGDYVIETTLEEFLNRSDKVIVGRLKNDYQYMINDTVEHISTNLLGKKYDYIFDLTDDTYYCSEIIYEGLKSS